MNCFVRASDNNLKLQQLRQAGQLEELKVRDAENRIADYFNFCTERGVLPTPAGMCSELGIHHRRLLKTLGETSELSEAIQNGMEVLHALYQEAVITGNMPVKTYTFFAKNYWGMSDKEVIELKTESNDVTIVEIDGRLNTLRQLSSLE